MMTWARGELVSRDAVHTGLCDLAASVCPSFNTCTSPLDYQNQGREGVWPRLKKGYVNPDQNCLTSNYCNDLVQKKTRAVVRAVQGLLISLLKGGVQFPTISRRLSILLSLGSPIMEDMSTRIEHVENVTVQAWW
jgi:hypothetical protein